MILLWYRWLLIAVQIPKKHYNFNNNNNNSTVIISFIAEIFVSIIISTFWVISFNVTISLPFIVLHCLFIILFCYFFYPTLFLPTQFNTFSPFCMLYWFSSSSFTLFCNTFSYSCGKLWFYKKLLISCVTF